MGKFETGRERKKVKPAAHPWEPAVKALTALVTLVLLGLALFSAADRYVIFAGLRPVLLTGEQVDLRDARLTVSEYEELARRLPDTEILWSVQVSGGYFESGAKKITVTELTEEDIPAFSHFDALETVEALQCENHAALLALEEAFPQLTVNWQVHLDGKAYSRIGEKIDLRKSSVDFETLQSFLGCFLQDTVVQVNTGILTAEQIEALKEQFPQLQISWGVELMGQKYPADTSELSFAGSEIKPEELLAVADQFDYVTKIDLSGCGFSLKDLIAVKEAYPDAFILAELELCGLELTTDTEEIDLSGIKITDTGIIEEALKLMPNLKKVIMSDCGLSDEEMDALNMRHENVRFVWTVYFSVYSLRTDAQAFCASNLPKNGYIGMKLNNKQLEPLKYCTDLIALDLGHMYYTDLSFLQDMHKLQYLILVDARYTDISVIAQMKELTYLELFKNNLDDLSPLLECKNLRHLNIGYTRGFDPEPLKQMTWLERLWFPGHGLSKEQKQEIIDALKDTEVYMPNYDADGSTGGSWRKDDVYFEMRNLFDMFYQPAGTGTNKNN